LVDLLDQRDAASTRLLDIGCGGGHWLGVAAEAGLRPANLCGIDLLEERVRAVRSRLPRATAMRADARALPLSDDSADVVLMFTLLSSLEDRAAVRQALREARRVLAPGGTLLVWDVRLPNPLNRVTTRPARADYRSILGRAAEFRRVTLLPPIARRLGVLAPRAYPVLAQVPVLTSHWLVRFDHPSGG
jgi:ubiquinone/menaquinone biosynthesis C-methylase UbiE